MSARYEIPDPIPVEVPLKFRDRPLTIQEEIARYVRINLSQHAAEQGEESFEEADDFDVEDENHDGPYQYAELEEESVPLAPRNAEPDKGSLPTPPVPAASPPQGGGGVSPPIPPSAAPAAP